MDQKIEGNADYVLTYSEVRAMMPREGRGAGSLWKIHTRKHLYSENASEIPAVVAAAVQESLKESGNDIDIKVCKANGAAECKKALLLMKVGRLPEDFIEGMACDGGCVGGPSSFKDQMLAKKSRDSLIKKADDRGIYSNLSNYDEESFSMHR